MIIFEIFFLQSGSALDAVEAAVRYMEDSPIFNAGHGSALTEENTAELDGFVMDGHNLATGKITCSLPADVLCVSFVTHSFLPH